MAFNYYTIDSIKQIDASDVPEAFIQYYQNLSEEMKEEIRDIRPDLVKVVETEDNATDQEMEQSVDDLTDQNTYSEDDEESDDEGYSPVVEAWEDISIRAWQKHEIETSVLVCKVIPANVLSCRIHKTPLVEKQIKIKRANGAIYSILGKWCRNAWIFFFIRRISMLCLVNLKNIVYHHGSSLLRILSRNGEKTRRFRTLITRRLSMYLTRG